MNCDIYNQYNEHVKYLDNPHTGEVTHYGTEKIIDVFKDVARITRCSSILEIGFNRGSSCLLFLLISNATITSLDVILKQKSVEYLSKNFSDRFYFLKADSKKLDFSNFAEFDLIFIDGDHSYEGMLSDTKKSLSIKPKYILFDDYEHPAHSADLKSIIRQTPELEIVKTYHNQCLCKVI